MGCISFGNNNAGIPKLAVPMAWNLNRKRGRRKKGAGLLEDVFMASAPPLIWKTSSVGNAAPFLVSTRCEEVGQGLIADTPSFMTLNTTNAAMRPTTCMDGTLIVTVFSDDF
mmetsp:Transcript_126620/g.188945  ORF Transcript_126620/g.188945 Transcript_126620/m.188945 type:complete len:112 (+) Transcript_126620:406-741(+)